MLKRKFRSWTICSINKIRSRSNESRKTDKTTSFSLQQNSHFEFCKELSLCRSAIQCRASQCSQIRFIVFRFKFTIDMFHLLIKTARNSNRVRALKRVSSTKITDCTTVVSSVCDCSWIFNDHSNSSKSHSKSSFDVVTWNTNSSISCKICIFAWIKSCIFAWNKRCVFFKIKTFFYKRARISSICCCKRWISSCKRFNSFSFWFSSSSSSCVSLCSKISVDTKNRKNNRTRFAEELKIKQTRLRENSTVFTSREFKKTRIIHARLERDYMKRFINKKNSKI